MQPPRNYLRNPLVEQQQSTRTVVSGELYVDRLRCIRFIVNGERTTPATRLCSIYWQRTAIESIGSKANQKKWMISMAVLFLRAAAKTMTTTLFLICPINAGLFATN